MFAHRDNQIGNQQTFSDVSLNRFGLHIHTADKLHLADHTGSFFLPVEDIDNFIIGSINRIIDHRIGSFSFGVQFCFRLSITFSSEYGSACMIFIQLKQPVYRIRCVILACIIHEIEDHEVILALAIAHTTTELLCIEHLGHCRSCHKQNLGLRAVPAFIEKVAGTKHFDISACKLGKLLISLGGFHAAGYRKCVDSGILEQLCNLFCMLDRCAENDGTLIFYIGKPCINNEFITFGNKDLIIEITDIVLYAVETHLCHIDIRMNSDTTDRDKCANFHSSLNIQLVCRILENFKNVGIIGTFGCCCKSERKLGLEICKNLLICIGRSMMCLVDDNIIKIVISEQLEIQSDTLNASADNMGIGIFYTVCEFADRYGFP